MPGSNQGFVCLFDSLVLEYTFEITEEVASNKIQLWQSHKAKTSEKVYIFPGTLHRV